MCYFCRQNLSRKEMKGIYRGEKEVLHPVYTELNDCQDCYKCIRACPVKAIRVNQGSASIMPERCLNCGKCVKICPVSAKQIRQDIDKVQWWLDMDKMIVLSLAPSYITHFDEKVLDTLIPALKGMGMEIISETALGAVVYNELLKKELCEGNGLKISSACPAVVALIRTYYPDFLPHLVDIASPMVLHAKMLKEMLGEEVKFVFAGPCAGKKKEADNHKELIDAALTFYELEDLLEIMPLKNQKSVSGFFPGKAGASSLYPMEGGLIQSMESPPSSYKCLSFSGLDIIKDFFEKREQVSLKENLFLELLACPHGCISGPGMNTKNPLIYRKHCMTLLDYPANNYVPDMPSECSLNIDQSEEVTFPEYKDQAINEILKTIGKESVESELNCGGCGYNTCHDLAKAILSGNAERQMCVSYMRQAAQAKANAILSKIPSGFVLVNDEMKIVQANKQFANILGDDIAELYEFHNGLAGADLSKVVSFHKQFLSVLHSGEEHVDFSISHHKKHLHITFFTVFPQQLVGAVVRDMELPDIRKTEVVRKARMVIDENYETMRKVADLLGDSLARNETVLNEIIEAHNNNQV